ncbi:MAG: conjugal transfer protein TraB [Treponema sp.]|nr:MAG: conjugal transfer protein TraB [Treponema sp.]
MEQPIKRISLGEKEIILLGTAHISQASMEAVEEKIREEKPDCVCVELDDARYQSLTNANSWETLDISKVIKEKKGFLLLANLVLSSFQKKLGTQIGVQPGEEMKAAITVADELNIPTKMVDRPIHITLRRAWGKTNFWGKSKILASLLSSAFTTEKLEEKEIEELKNESAMDNMMKELADYMPAIKTVLIDERDRWLATNIKKAEGRKILAVLGAGHLPGTEKHIHALENKTATEDLSEIGSIPPKSLFSKIAGYLLPALIIGLIVAGFFLGDGTKSWSGLLTWLIWNGGLAALGTLLAGGHILAIITGFVCAPVATINPFIGIGLFTALVQAWIRKPKVRDMMKLTDDVTSFKGWYKNRIARVLLVFFLSSLGGSIGNFVALPALISNLF